MNFIKIAKRDISSIFKNRFIRVSVTAVIIVPLLYSLTFLSAFWDPYSKLEHMKVAVVNLDKGGVSNGATVNYGNDIVDKLRSNHEVGWTFTTKAEAAKGLTHKKYYAEFVIPENFSEKSSLAEDGKPETLNILYRANEKESFLAAQIDGKVKLQLKDEITKNIIDKATKKIFDTIKDVKPGFDKLEAGSKELKDGVAILNKGTPNLKSGVDKLTDALTLAANGVNDMNVAVNGKPLKVEKVVSNINQNNDLVKLLKPSNVKSLKSVMADATKLKDADTSMLSIVPKLATSNNIDLMAKISNDAKKADIGTLINDPTIKSLPTFMTPKTLTSIGTLLNDASKLSNIDMIKLLPMMSLLNQSTQLSGLMDQAQMLAQMDMSKLDAIKPLLGQTKQLGGLMTQAGMLAQMDMSKLDAIKPLLAPENAKELSSILTNANGLSSINTKDMGTFLTTQIAGIDAFDNDTTILRNSDTQDSLLQLVDAKYPPTGSAVDKLANAKLKAVLSGYFKAVTQTDASMQASKPVLKSMGATLSGLGAIQTQLANDSKLIAGVNSALTTDNVTAIGTMLAQLQAAQNAMKTPESLAAMKTVQTALTPENIKSINDMLTQLQTAQNAMKAPEAMAAIKTVQSTLSPENITYIKGVLGQLTAMKTDLDANKANLQVTQGLMLKLQDPKTVAAIDKIKVLAEDLKKATPLVAVLQKEMTSENLTKLKSAPKLVTQLTSMQKELQDNNMVLLMSQKALTDDNVTLANNLVNSIPDMSSKVNMLAAGTASFSKELNKYLNSSDALQKFASEPVVMNDKPLFPVGIYGRGFTPYFIPLALWIGALLMFFVISDKVDDDIKAGTTSTVIGKYLSYGFIGIIQAVLASTAILFLGLKPTSLVMYYAFNIVMSLAFIAIIQCLVFLLGMAGRLIAIILLLLQLTSCAGTFPIELVPKFFKIINPLLPLTYCVSGLREITAGIDYSVLNLDFIVLIGMGAIFLVISVLFKGHADKVQEMIQDKKNSIA